MFEENKEYIDLLQFIKMFGKKKEFLKNQFVFSEYVTSEEIYLLDEGWVKITKEEENGRNTTLSIRKAGDIMGLAEVLSMIKQRERNAYTLTNCTVYILSAEQLFKYADQHTEIWHLLSKVMATRLLETQNFLKVFTTKTVPERLAWLLCAFAKTENGVMLANLPLTHDELSFIIGCSRQKVSFYLSKWRKNGIIEYQRGAITILKKEALLIDDV